MTELSVREPSAESDPIETEPIETDPIEPGGERMTRSRGAEILIVLIGSGLLVLTGIIALNFLTARSRDAVINATPIAIRTPITGTLQSLPVQAGQAVRLDQELAVIRSSRASRDELERLTTERQEAQSRQADLRRQVLAQKQLVAEVQLDAGRQQALEIRRNREDLDQTTADLQRARAELAFTERETKRVERLFRTGAVAANVYDRAQTTEKQRRRELTGLEARLAGGRTDLEAATNNLVLRNNRSGSDPVVRLQEARRSLQALQGDLSTQDQRVAGLGRQLAASSQQWEKRHKSILRSPRQAVVWELQAQAGDLLEALQPVMKLIDCNNRWVTTTVAENDLNRLRIGDRARIELVGRRMTLRGEVESIRSGIGRLQLGDDPLVPIPINLARESEVRVRILNDVPAPPLQFCYVGYTGRVIFER
ncbi:HlyD family secretion protein [Synechococcus sp. CS-1332]|uniref:HlyD family secretion protein n=1 Tax=Synechococcus sp. CS-1332 TaxID=2847972 RepID=UPI00223B4663|nr:HlyD family efflux transporter periplasmic adaptor subunit [Synechococcus sp. CS-1332]MCT0207545.1 HlyD family efflux transporter periplasmic adaptor subunit [Synechococcus sp. CS-1332]